MNTDRINSTIPVILGGSACIGIVGSLGAHLVRAYVKDISLIGVGVTCALTPLIAMGFLICKSPKGKTFTNIEVALNIALTIFAAYPVAAFVTKMTLNVNPLHPLIGFGVGLTAIGGSVITVGAVGFVFYMAFKQN